MMTRYRSVARSPVAWAAVVVASWGIAASGATASGRPPSTAPATQPATSRASTLTRLKPYTAFAWTPVGPMAHIQPFLWVNTYGNPGLAAQTAKRMPDGCRIIFCQNAADGLLGQPDDRCRDEQGQLTTTDSIWPDKGVEIVSRRWGDWWAGFAQAGGTCDFFVLDFEANWSNWALKPPHLAAIARDPRFGPVAQKLGFTDPADKADYEKTAASGEYLKWNAVTAAMLART